MEHSNSFDETLKTLKREYEDDIEEIPPIFINTVRNLLKKHLEEDPYDFTRIIVVSGLLRQLEFFERKNKIKELINDTLPTPS